ncbi:MAG: hypothetical protein HPY66_0338 [Firmicutes bacterium]|nr:hypothetical protein [Bacillota bacterium]
MNKRLIFILFTVVLLVAFSACARKETQPPQQDQTPQEGAIKDGVYFQEGEADERGWKPMITIIVNNGKIVKAHYDEINQENNLKGFDQEYLDDWKDKSGTNLLTAEKKLVDSLIEKQDPEQVDSVTGATSTTGKFKDLAAKALKNNPQDKKSSGYYNGLFKAELDFDERGWKPYAAVIVRNEKIAGAYYDEVNKDTEKLKSYDDDYNQQWQEKSVENLRSARPKLIDSLLEKQKPGEVDAVTGATSTTSKFKELMQKALTPFS